MEEENVILCAGDYPSHPRSLSVLRSAKRVVCCDGAAAAFIEHEGKRPWSIVGDGDSLSATLKVQCADILHSVEEQESNDQTKATRFLMKKGYRKIAYVGATGKREDHTLGNISLLMEYLSWGLDVRMYTDYGCFVPCHNVFKMRLSVGTQISIFNFGAIQLQSTGLRWPVRDFSNWWMGTLNEVSLPDVEIQGEGNFLVFVNYT